MVTSVREGQRVRLTGRAWGYASQNREVYARITYADGGYAKIDEREVLSSGMFVDGYEFELADLAPPAKPTIADAAKELGIDLLPWQLELAERFQRGERVVMTYGQRAGQSTFRRVLERWQELTESERRASA